MELFTISLLLCSEHDTITLTHLLQQELGDLYKQPNGVELHLWSDEHMVWITCQGKLPSFQLSNSLSDESGDQKLHNQSVGQTPMQGQNVWDKTAKAIAEFILSCKEQPLLSSLIAKSANCNEEDQRKIEAYCLQLLNSSDESGANESRCRRKNNLIRVLRRYLEEHTVLHVDGFIRFRLQHYVSELREVVDYAIDEYMLEYQYQEFIGLLKYFVFIQETKISLAHLMHKGGHEFSLLGEDLKPLESKQDINGMLVKMMDYDMEMEDMIVSTLINVSPQNIIIHTREPELQVIKTIQQIFESRVHICIFCGSCHSALDVKNWNSRDFCT